MAANKEPVFALTPQIGGLVTQLTAANTARDGTGTIVTLITGGTNGTRISQIDIVAAVTTTAGVIRLFISNGTNHRLWKEILVTAITPSTTVAVFSSTVTPATPLVIPSGYFLRGSTHNAETFNVIVHAGDY